MQDAALLVIDLQRGAFDGVRCPPIDQPETLIGNAVRLVGAARAAGTPIVFIQHCEGAGEVFEENTPHWQLHEALAPQPGDRHVHKRASSAFEGTDLRQMLDGLGAKRLVVCGLQSEFCVFNTTRSALALGYEVVLADDAHGTWPSKTATASSISQGINRDLAQAGASLQSTQTLARAFAPAAG